MTKGNSNPVDPKRRAVEDGGKGGDTMAVEAGGGTGQELQVVSARDTKLESIMDMLKEMRNEQKEIKTAMNDLTATMGGRIDMVERDVQGVRDDLQDVAERVEQVETEQEEVSKRLKKIEWVLGKDPRIMSWADQYDLFGSEGEEDEEDEEMVEDKGNNKGKGKGKGNKGAEEGKGWQVKGKGKGKDNKGKDGKGMTEEKKEELSRSVVFGRFPDGTLTSDIIDHLKGEMEGEDVEEIYGRGPKYANQGVVRFPNLGSMWTWMVDNKGKYMEFDGKKVFKEVAFVEGEDKDKIKGLRKAKRAIYEERDDVEDGDVTVTYGVGVVRFKGKRVAAWCDEDRRVKWEDGYEAEGDRHDKLMMV